MQVAALLELFMALGAIAHFVVWELPEPSHGSAHLFKYRRVGRDFKGVHSDVTTLRNNGLLWKATDGNVVFPFRSLQFEYEVSENQSAA